MSTDTLPAPTKSPLAVSRNGGIQLNTLDDIWRFATAVSKSGLAPKGIQSPEAITVAIQMGLEVGLTPMSALQNIAVINGRPSLWGDSQLAVVRATGELEEFTEWYEDKGERLPRNPTAFGDAVCCVVRVKRRGFEAVEVSFSVSDAKLAKLWGKDGPWSQYPARMLKFRARSFALRDTFGDALRGMRSAEEVMDEPVIREVAGRVVSGDDPRGQKRENPFRVATDTEDAQPGETVVVTDADQEEKPEAVALDREALGNKILSELDFYGMNVPSFEGACRKMKLMRGAEMLNTLPAEKLQAILTHGVPAICDTIGKGGEA